MLQKHFVSLRYTTKHLNEEATPKNIKNLLAAWEECM